MPRTENAKPFSPRKADLPFSKRLGGLLNTIIFFLLLAIVVFANVPYGTVDAWWEALFESSIFALTIVWIFEGLLTGWEWKRLTVLLPLIALVGFAFVQIIVWPAWLPSGRLTVQHTLSIDRYQTFLTARKALALLLFIALLLYHTTSHKRLSRLVSVIIGLGLGSATFGILRQFLQAPDSQASFVLPFLFPKVGYGQFIYHNAFAYLMEMSLALVLGLILGGGLKRQRLLIYLAMGVIIWTALVLSNSRGGIIAFTCQAIFLLFTSLTWYSARRMERDDGVTPGWIMFMRNSALVRVIAVALIVIALISGVLWMGGERLASRFEELNSQDEAIHGLSRTSGWQSTWVLIKQNPWTGVGFGNYFLAIPQYKKGSGTVKLEQAHNDYLDLAANGGVVAIILTIWYVGLLIQRGTKTLRSVDPYRRAASLGAVAGIIGIAVHSLVDFCLQVTGIALVFAALIVIWVAGNEVESPPRQPKPI